MGNTPNTDLDWTVHSINIHGVFFERWCQSIIEKSQSWMLISHNYPVAYPPNEFMRESTLDVRAEMRAAIPGGWKLTLLIECKKNNPDFIDWIFFPRKYRGYEGNPRFMAIENQAHELPRTVPDEWIVRPYFSDALVDLPIADEARETRGLYEFYPDKKTKTKTSNAAISDAARQIALATQAIYLEEFHISQIKAVESSPGSPPWTKQAFLPMILTSARIFTCSFDPSDVDPERGEIPYDRATLSEVPYLLYRYPLIKNLQPMEFTGLLGSLKFHEIEPYIRRDIFIVHSNKFDVFLNHIAGHAQYFTY